MTKEEFENYLNSYNVVDSLENDVKNLALKKIYNDETYKEDREAYLNLMNSHYLVTTDENPYVSTSMAITSKKEPGINVLVTGINPYMVRRTKKVDSENRNADVFFNEYEKQFIRDMRKLEQELMEG